MKINLQPVPEKLPEDVEALVTAEISKIDAPEIVEGLKSFLIRPRIEMFWWDWHKPAKKYAVWVVAESSVYDYGIAYSDYGFGPDRPWGLIFLSKNNFDADYCWYSSLKDAYLESRLIEELEERKNSASD